jgi:hypothetical protein
MIIIFVYLISSYFFMAVFNHKNKEGNNYNFVLFEGVKSNPTKKKDFYFGYLNDSILYQGEMGYKFIFIDHIVSDTLIGYWGVKDYTLFYWDEHSYKRNCPQIIPFASFALPTQYTFCEKNCYEYRHLSMGGNCVEVSNRPKKSGIIETNHLLYSNHMSHQASYFRRYTISYDKGIIDYKTDYPPTPTIINFPY